MRKFRQLRPLRVSAAKSIIDAHMKTTRHTNTSVPDNGSSSLLNM